MKAPEKIFTLLSIIAVAACLAGLKTARSPYQASAPRPNIVLILADDMGFSDAGCYGGEIHTPNLDYLAKNGIRFTRFYNTSRCCPTRASLLTGMYQHQAGIGNMTNTEPEPGYLGRISDNTVTLAEVLKTAGYHTDMSGKWHVSNTLERKDPQEQLDWLNHQKDFGDFSPIAQYPTNRGFERYFGNIWGVVNFYDPFSLVSGTTPVKHVPSNYYHTDAINDTAVSYINSHRTSKTPFFLYVAQTAPHWPLQAPEEEIAKYADTYKVGWNEIRNARYQRMVKMGLINPAVTRLSPAIDRGTTWNDNPAKVYDARAMAVHAAMIDRMDQGIGRIIDALRKTNKLDNTLIVFLSDNGASPEMAANFGPGFDRPSQTRDGRKIWYPVDKDRMPGPQTVYGSIGPFWANVANTPYEYAKAESYEGGIHTPMIAFWPGGIKTNKGGFSDQVGHVMDFMNTFIELSGAKYPASYRGKPVKQGTGISLVPAFLGKKASGHTILFNEHYRARYVRSGDWKLVSTARDSTWHLFDLAHDGSETTDLAQQNPAKVNELRLEWLRWAGSSNVYPKPKARAK